MLSKTCFAIVGALTIMAQTALAAETASSLCVDVSVPKGVVAAAKGKWIELSDAQLQFLRGIYAMNPQTPPGLPFGDKAAMAEVDGNDGGMVFFIDGDRACSPMTLPHELLAMMDDVATAKIIHEAKGL
jgi:hypothetical protein